MSSKTPFIVCGLLTVGLLAAAIAVNAVATTKCTFMIGSSSECLSSPVVLCCQCCDTTDPKRCPPTSCKIQKLEGLGLTLIIFFWVVFAGFLCATIFLFFKMRRQGGDSRVLLIGTQNGY